MSPVQKLYWSFFGEFPEADWYTSVHIHILAKIKICNKSQHPMGLFQKDPARNRSDTEYILSAIQFLINA